MISISIISPLKSMAVIDKAIEHNDFGCVFHRYVYENLEEIKDIYEQCKDISDVLFFSGELGYSYILTHVDDLKVPCTFISYTEKTLLSILFAFSSPTYLQCQDSYAILVLSSLSSGYLKINP